MLKSLKNFTIKHHPKKKKRKTQYKNIAGTTKNLKNNHNHNTKP